MDCPICFNIIKKSAIGSCTHHFCISCLIKWCEFGGTKCPTCKLPIIEIRPDKEFDEITEQYLSDSFDLSDELDLSNNYEKITVNFKKNDYR